MTTATTPFGARPHPEIDEGTLSHGPREGWSSLILLILVMLAAAFAIDDANWAGPGPGRERQTDFLPLLGVLSIVVGFVLAKSTLRTGLAHLLGALAGAAWLLVSAANAISQSSSLTLRLRDLSESTAIFYQDLVVSGIRSSETSVFLLVLGGLLWAAGQFAAFNAFRRSRATPGVVCLGLVLLINMSITIRGQYLHLILFSAAASLLLVRMNLVSERSGWHRRRIGDSSYMTHRFLQNGAVFVAVTVLGAALLAATATSAPLANAWRDLDDHLLTAGTEINRLVGGITGAARGPSGSFGSSQTIRGVWESSSERVFRVESSDGEGHYWLGATYDVFDGFTWQQQDRSRTGVPAGGELLAAGPEGYLDDTSRREVTVRVTSIALAGDTLLAPEAPIAVDRDAEVLTSGQGGPIVAVDLADAIDPDESYTVTSLVQRSDPEDGGLTSNDLAAAGVEYPAWASRFIDIRPGSIGDGVYSTAERIVSRLPDIRRDPYHVALAMQEYFYSDGGFEYNTDVRGLCGRERIADCLLRIKVGYCEYFATTMAMMLRTQQIPARMALGYLPGRRQADRSWEVDSSAAHAWVEVYFPGHGWIRFDPTPGNQLNGQRPTVLEEAVDEPSAPRPSGPRPSPDFETPNPNIDLRPDPPGGPGAAAPPGQGPPADPIGSAAPILLIAGLLLGVAIVLYAMRRRLPAPEPDLAYRGVARLAGRFGYGPRPDQTAYEYAGALGEILPQMRTDLQLVARAKVETTYARRTPEADFLEQLRNAYRRVRIGLLRMAVRRRWLPSRRSHRDS